jgi:hypothetical protein
VSDAPPPLSELWALTSSAAPPLDDVLKRLVQAKFVVEQVQSRGAEPWAEREATVHFEQKPARGAFGEVLSRKVVLRSGAPPNLARARPGVFGLPELPNVQGAVGVAMQCAEVPALELHAQLKLLLAAEPNGVACFDESANALRTVGWARDAARARTPPAPAALFTIRPAHPVVRTFGLRRFGHPEFQIEGVKLEHVTRASTLLGTWCALFLDGEGVASGRPLALAPGLQATWVLRDQGLAAVVPAGGGGGLFDRPEPPVWFSSKVEGVRAALLAQERLPQLQRLMGEHGKEPSWTFWAKAPVAGEGEAATEHLWFELLDLDDARWRGRVWSRALSGVPKVGEELTLPVEELSDWRVEGPDGAFGPDNCSSAS